MLLGQILDPESENENDADWRTGVKFGLPASQGSGHLWGVPMCTELLPGAGACRLRPLCVPIGPGEFQARITESKSLSKPGVVAHACNPSTWEAEAGGSARV